MRLTGGPYDGDEGTITGKNDDGHYRIVFRDSMHPVFNVRRKTFVLWLGNWFVEETTHGYGICPGGRLPFVNVFCTNEETTRETARENKEGGEAEEKAKERGGTESTESVETETKDTGEEEEEEEAKAKVAVDDSKYRKMLLYNMPAGALRHKMTVDGFPQHAIAAFFAVGGPGAC